MGSQIGAAVDEDASAASTELSILVSRSPTEADERENDDSTNTALDRLVSSPREGDLTDWSSLVQLNSFSFFYGLFKGGNMVMIPAEVDRMFGLDKDIMLGLTAGIAGILTVVGPISGCYSDVCRSKHGRRRPFLFWGSALCVAGLFLMLLFSDLFGEKRSTEDPLTLMRKLIALLFIISFLIANTGLTIATTAYNCLIPDFIPKSHLGKASGYMALMTLLGNICGFLFYFFTNGDPTRFWLLYFIYALTVVATVGNTCMFIREPALNGDTHSLTLRKVVVSLLSSIHYKSDFFWVWISRVLYYMGLSVLAYLQYYVKDVMKSSNPVMDSASIGCVALFGGLLSSVPTGRLSDKVGRKKLIYSSTFLLVLSYMIFPNTKLISTAIAAGAIFGFGQGTYISVEWAMGCLTLPDMQNQAGKDLGVWSIAQMFGDVVGPFTTGPLLYFFGRFGGLEDAPEGVASQFGYQMIMGLGSIYFIIAAFLVSFVKSVK